VVKIGDFLVRTWGIAAIDRVFRSGSRLFEGHPNQREQATYYLLHYGLLHHRGPDGRTAAQVWSSRGWEGLNNDERVLMRHLCQSVLTVVEVQKQVSADTLTVIDLFSAEPSPVLLFNRALAQEAVRFSRFLVWLTRYPHFDRLLSSAWEIPVFVWPDWRDGLLHEHANQRQANPDLSVSQYLAANLEAWVKRIGELADEKRRRALSAIDLTACAAIYRLTGPVSEIESLLRSRPDFKPGTPPADTDREPPLAFFHWRAEGESAEFIQASTSPPPKGPPLEDIGSVWLYDRRMVVESFTKKRHAFIRRMAEKFFGPAVQFEDEAVVDLAQMRALQARAREAVGRVSAWLDDEGQREPKPTLSAEAPSPAAPEPDAKGAVDSGAAWENHRQQVEAEHARLCSAFLNQTFAGLNNRTPREAASDPTLRPALVELVKDQLHFTDHRSRREGVPLNADRLLDELGLNELK
jgi:hypothetical protein